MANVKISSKREFRTEQKAEKKRNFVPKETEIAKWNRENGRIERAELICAERS